MKRKNSLPRNAPLFIFFALFAAYAAGRFSFEYRMAAGGLIEKLNSAFALSSIYPFKPPSFESSDLAMGLAGAFAVLLAWLYIYSTSDSAFFGKEYGTARWGSRRDIAPFVNPDFSKNILLTETERISLASNPKQKKAGAQNRNNNVLVIGGSGSGKSRYVIKPQIAQMNASYIITDPKGARPDRARWEAA